MQFESIALHALFFLAAEPGANVVVPRPSYPPFLVGLISDVLASLRP